jgi:hypothetical protein
MADEASKSNKGTPAGGAKTPRPQPKKGQAPSKRKESPSGVEDPFPDDPFELPGGSR